MKLRSQAIITLGLILTTALIILVWNKQPTIYPYVIVATAFAGLVAFSVIGYHMGFVDKFSTLFLIFFVFMLLRNVPFVATHYSALTPVGVTEHYAVINTFSQMDKIFVIPPSAFSNVLTMYSSWPLLHTFSLIFADVLGTKIFLLPIVLSTVFSIIGFLFVYLIADRLSTDLRLNKVIVPLSLLFYAVSPEAIYFAFNFANNSLALVFILVELYLLYKYIRHRDGRILALIMLNVIAMVLTHHYTSFVFTAYSLSFAGLTFVLVLVSRRAKPRWLGWFTKFRKEAAIIGIVGLLSASSIFVYWSQVATVMQPLASGVITRITQVITPSVKAETLSIEPETPSINPETPSINPETPSINPYIPEGHYPESLTPPWVNLLWVRDFLIYIPVFFGFGWLFRKRYKEKASNTENSAAFYFLTISLVCFGVFFLFELLVSDVEPYRLPLLILPLIALCSAVAYEKLLSKGRWQKWLTFAALVSIIVGSFLGLQGHRNAPIYLYSSAVSAQDFAEPATLTSRHYEVQHFISAHALDHEATAIFSDNNYLLYLILHPEEYNKIGRGWRELGSDLHHGIAIGDNLLVIDFGAQSYNTPYGTITGEEAERLRSQYRAELEPNLNEIYSNGFEVWLSPAKER